MRIAAAAVVATTAALVSFTASCGNNTVPGVNPAAPVPSAPSTVASSSSTDLGDAEAVLAKINTHVEQVSLNKVYSEDDDPNKLLGRPNGYTSKVAFRDTRINQKDQDDIDARSDAIERGGSIEVFPDDAGAKARVDYIQGLLKGGGLGSEYDYTRGPVVVRVTGDRTLEGAHLRRGDCQDQLTLRLPNRVSNTHASPAILCVIAGDGSRGEARQPRSRLPGWTS